MKKVEVKVLRGNKWQTDRELVLKEKKVYVLKNKELRINKIGDIKLLVAKSNKGCGKACRWIWYVLKNKKPYRNTGRKTNDKWSVEETMNVFDS